MSTVAVCGTRLDTSSHEYYSGSVRYEARRAIPVVTSGSGDVRYEARREYSGSVRYQ